MITRLSGGLIQLTHCPSACGIPCSDLVVNQHIVRRRVSATSLMLQSVSISAAECNGAPLPHDEAIHRAPPCRCLVMTLHYLPATFLTLQMQARTGRGIANGEGPAHRRRSAVRCFREQMPGCRFRSLLHSRAIAVADCPIQNSPCTPESDGGFNFFFFRRTVVPFNIQDT